MKVEPIQTEADYTEALKRVDYLMGAKKNTPEGDELDQLVSLVEEYEEKHHSVS